MANVKIVLNPIAVLNKVILVVRYNSNLAAIVHTEVFDPPHAQRNFTVNNLSPVMCRFEFWESVDGVSLDDFLGAADIDASIGFEAILEVVEFIVDGPGGPADGSDTFSDPRLANVQLAGANVIGTKQLGSVYQVFQRGVGPKLVSELTDLYNPGGFMLTGGFMLNDGDKFSTGDVWIVNIHHKRPLSQTTLASEFFSDIVHKNVDFALDASYYNKKICLESPGPVQIVDVPALATIPKKKFFTFDTHGAPGSLNYAWIRFTDLGVKFNGVNVTNFFLARGEELTFAIDDLGLPAVVIHYKGNARERGRFVFDYADRPGFIRAIGQEVTKADYPGLYAWVLSLPPGVAVDPATWAATIPLTTERPSKRRWMIDPTVGAEKIGIPDLRDITPKTLKLDGVADPWRIFGDVPGGVQYPAVGQHTHKKSRGSTKRGSGSDPNGHAFKTPTGDTFGANFDDDSGPVLENPGGQPNSILNFGQLPLITL